MIGAKLNRQKLLEAIHFVTRKYATTPEKLGAVKLQKILWYFEIKSATHTGAASIGAEFVKLEHGPYTYELDNAVGELVSKGRLYADTHTFFDNEKARFVGKGQTDLAVFNEREQRWLDEISTEICESHTAESISRKSHDAIWKMAEYKQRIPLLAAVVRLHAPNDSAIDAINKELEAAL